VLILPDVNTAGMQMFLDAFAATIAKDEHVALVVDGAGWHGSKTLNVPSNITLVALPPYCQRSFGCCPQQARAGALQRLPSPLEGGEHRGDGSDGFGLTCSIDDNEVGRVANLEAVVLEV
jgi:hypothetical protein